MQLYSYKKKLIYVVTGTRYPTFCVRSFISIKTQVR